MRPSSTLSSLFFFNDTATTEIYTLSLHDALPIFFLEASDSALVRRFGETRRPHPLGRDLPVREGIRLERSEEHTSELQSPVHLVCRLLLEKKKTRVESTRHLTTSTVKLERLLTLT